MNQDQATALLAKSLADRGIVGKSGLKIFLYRMKGESFTKDDLILAFKAGAQHIFGATMSMLDPSGEPTKADIRRMKLLDAEMGRWADDLSQVFEK